MRDVNPTLRGFAIIVIVAAAITAAGAQSSLIWIVRILGILFLIVIAWALYRLWRTRREEISMWSRRSQTVFYGAAAVAVANLAAAWVPVLDYPEGGLEVLVFFLVFGFCGFAMIRVWRDQHTYGY